MNSLRLLGSLLLLITTAFAQRVGDDGGYGVPTDAVRAAIASAGVKPLETPCVER